MLETATKTELLIGCGSARDKRVGLGESAQLDPWQNLVTCDINADHDPDVVCDLEQFPWPWPDDAFDEVHAYEVLEHISGQQGDAVAFFRTFSEVWRILKPGGVLCGTVPSPGTPWVWADPSHRRAIFPATLVFLSQAEYEAQVGKTPMSDFRYLYKADFVPVHLEVHDETFSFILRAVK